MYKFRLKKEPNSFKLGMLSGICLFLTIENVVSLYTLPEMQITRFLLAIVFGALGLGCVYMGCRKSK